MKVIIRESRLMDLAVKFVDSGFPDLIEEPLDNSVLYINPINNTHVFEYDEGDDSVVFYGDVSSRLRDMFDLSEKEIKTVVREWLYTYYGLNPSRLIVFLN
jgi:hypothetical protein